MSIEVLTRRIERLKHHLHLLDDNGGSGASHDASQSRHRTGGTTGAMELAPLMHGKHRETFFARSNAAQRLPNASFGAGATLVSRQRQALAAAVQQAAARGITQIRDELQTEETTLFGQLLRKYVALCEGLMEAPDTQFFADSVEDDRGGSSTASSPQRSLSAADASAEGDIDNPNKPMVVDDSSHHNHQHPDPQQTPVLHRSHSVVGLDAAQRGRNAKVEQLAVACQILLARRRRFDLLDAKLKDVEVWTQRFNDTLRDCSRLLRISTASTAGVSTATVSSSAANKNVSPQQLSRQAPPQQAAVAPPTKSTKLAPIAPIPSRKQTPNAPLSPGTIGDARSPRGTPIGRAGDDKHSYQGTTSSSSSLKVLNAKVHDALAEVRGAVIRLLLHLQDLMAEQHGNLDGSLEQSGRLMQSMMGSNEKSRGNSSSLLLERKQAVLHERMARVCHLVKMAYADAPEFCPPSLGAVCATPLFVDVAALLQSGEGGLRDQQQRRASSTMELRGGPRSLVGDHNPTTVPIAQLRMGSVSGGDTIASSIVDAPTSGGRRSSASRVSSLTGGNKSVLVPRSVRDSETLMVHRAYDVWTKLANTLSIDVPPTAVPFVERYVAPAASHGGAGPTMYLRHAVIDSRHPELLHELTSAAGRMYSEADLLGAVLGGGHGVACPRNTTSATDAQPNRWGTGAVVRSTTGAVAAPSSFTEEHAIAAAAAAAMTSATAPSQPSSPARATSPHPTHQEEEGDVRALSVEHHPLCDVSDIVSTTQRMEGAGEALMSALLEDATSTTLTFPTECGPTGRPLRSGAEDAGDATLCHPHQLSSLQDTVVHTPAVGMEAPSPFLAHVRSLAVRAALNVRREQQQQQQMGISTPVKPAPSPPGENCTPCDDSGTDDQRRAVRLVAITERLHLLHAQRRIFRFAHGFVVHGKGRRHRAASAASSTGSNERANIDELSVLLPFEAHQAQRIADEWGSDYDAVTASVGQVLARRDELRHAMETNAAAVVVRFMRRCIARRRNRARLVAERTLRQQKVAVRAVERWWVEALPSMRARRHARRHTQSLTRDRLQRRLEAFERCSNAIQLLQRVIRGFVMRYAFGCEYPKRKLAIQSEAVANALWFRQAQKEVSTKRALSASRRASGQASDLRVLAAVRIQALVRRMCACTRVRTMKSRQVLERRVLGGASATERQYATRRLQRAWRRHVAIETLRKRRASALIAAGARFVAERRKWAVSKLVGFAQIASAKRLTNGLRVAAALREKESRRLARNPSRKRAEMNAAIKHAMKRADAVAAQQLLQMPDMAHASDLVQRHLQRTMKLDPSVVPKLDLEANFLSNVSDSSRTLEREDDSFEVRLMHRLLQAPTALLYLLSTFVGTTAATPQEEDKAQPLRPANSVAVEESESDCDGSDSDPEEDAPDARHGRRLFRGGDDAEDASTSPPTPDGGEALCSFDAIRTHQPPVPASPDAHAQWNVVRRSMHSARLTYRGHGELLLEDHAGVPSVPRAPEPFAKWSIAHQLVFRIFDEAAVYAWKMIFSHTTHDAFKQSQLSTDKERIDRMARVQQRNQLILACYDCDSESQWLASAKKNIGFVGKIWSPIRYLGDDDDDDSIEDRALESYRFVDDFLLQCFPSAYSLRDVPGLLVACGLYLAMKRSLDTSLTSLLNTNPDDNGNLSTRIEVTHDPKRVAQLVQQELLEPSQSMSSPVLSCAHSCLDALVQLQRLSEECLSPTVTVAPSRRSVQDDNDNSCFVEGDSDDDEDDDGEEDDDDDEDDDDGYRRAMHDTDPRGSAAAVTKKKSQRCEEGYGTPHSDLPERSGARLGFIGERESSAGQSSRDNHDEDPATPSTGSNLFPANLDRHASSVDDDELGEGVPPASSDELSDSERDEELAKQMLLEQHHMAPLSPEGYAAATLMGLHVGGGDGLHRREGGLDGTGHGQYVRPPGAGGDSCSDSDCAFEDDGIVRLTVAFAPSPASGVLRPRVTIEPSTMVGSLAERLAAALLDVRADTQMFDDI